MNLSQPHLAADRARLADDLWTAHATELMRFATVLVGASDAPDIVTDAFLNVMPKWAAGEIREARPYLFRAVSNRAKDQRRSQARRRRRELAHVGPMMVDLPDDHSEVRRALADLTVRQRAVVYLTYWRDLPERQVATLLDVSPGTVHTTLQRAQRTLRAALGAVIAAVIAGARHLGNAGDEEQAPPGLCPRRGHGGRGADRAHRLLPPVGAVSGHGRVEFGPGRRTRHRSGHHWGDRSGAER